VGLAARRSARCRSALAVRGVRCGQCARQSGEETRGGARERVHRSRASMKQQMLSPAHNAARMPAPRGFWPMRDVPTIAWLALTVAAVLFHRQIPVPRWLMIHLLLLGAVTHAILVWSQ